MFIIYLCGAQSTGKTTLFNDLKKHLNLRFEEEIARSVIKRLGWTKEDLLPYVYPEKFLQLNIEIVQTQITAEMKNISQNRDFIFDRGIDPIVYVELHLGKEKADKMYNLTGVQQWLERMKESLVFVLYPHKECIQEDGARLDATMEDLNAFTIKLEQLLNKENIPYHTVTELDRYQRVHEILHVIKGFHPKAILCEEF